jgi:hypothetical protein
MLNVATRSLFIFILYFFYYHSLWQSSGNTNGHNDGSHAVLFETMESNVHTKCVTTSCTQAIGWVVQGFVHLAGGRFLPLHY